MTTDAIMDLLPNPTHLRDTAVCLRKHRPDGMWCEEEIDARILTVWADNLDELIERLQVDGATRESCGREKG
jgi:hypothetical protein